MKKLTAALAFCLLLTGCQYYKVTDLATNRNYYTNSIQRKYNGAVVFKDGRTGAEVTLQSTNIAKISKEEFEYSDLDDQD